MKLSVQTPTPSRSLLILDIERTIMNIVRSLSTPSTPPHTAATATAAPLQFPSRLYPAQRQHHPSSPLPSLSHLPHHHHCHHRHQLLHFLRPSSHQQQPWLFPRSPECALPSRPRTLLLPPAWVLLEAKSWPTDPIAAHRDPSASPRSPPVFPARAPACASPQATG